MVALLPSVTNIEAGKNTAFYYNLLINNGKFISKNVTVKKYSEIAKMPI